LKPRWLDRRIACPGPYLALCLSADEFGAAMRHLKVTSDAPWIKNGHSNATAHYFDAPDGRGLVCIVCIAGWEARTPIEVAGLLVHEAVHAWQAYARQIGENNPGDEQEAYAVQSIAQELMAEFARRAVQSMPAP
jgi:hypothetical protein